jgi:hypothetical protein
MEFISSSTSSAFRLTLTVLHLISDDDSGNATNQVTMAPKPLLLSALLSAGDVFRAEPALKHRRSILISGWKRV